MKVKSLCLVCRGAKVRLGAPCLGCEGYGWVYVKYEPAPKPESILEKEEVEQHVVVKPKKVRVKQELLVEEPLPPPDRARRVLGIRAKTRGLTEKIITVVKQYQHAYLSSMDIMQLRPMVLQNIADLAGCDAVTVHLHLAGERIQGVPARDLFSESVSGVSRKVVKEMMRVFIGEKNTYSDIEIKKYLETRGISVSRRTVAKYRKELRIPSKAEYKKHDC